MLLLSVRQGVLWWWHRVQPMQGMSFCSSRCVARSAWLPTVLQTRELEAQLCSACHGGTFLLVRRWECAHGQCICVGASLMLPFMATGGEACYRT